MSQERVLQYEFFTDKEETGTDKRFVVRAYLRRQVLRKFPLSARWALRRYITGRMWYEDFLPQRLSAWLSGRSRELSSDEFRTYMVQYLCYYIEQSDYQTNPIGVENRGRFILATDEEKIVLAILLEAKRKCALYVYSPNYIMKPEQIFLMSAN